MVFSAFDISKVISAFKCIEMVSIRSKYKYIVKIKYGKISFVNVMKVISCYSNEELHHALIQFGETSAECQTATEKQAELTTDEGKQHIHRLVKLAGDDMCKNFSSGKIKHIEIKYIQK